MHKQPWSISYLDNVKTLNFLLFCSYLYIHSPKSIQRGTFKEQSNLFTSLNSSPLFSENNSKSYDTYKTLYDQAPPNLSNIQMLLWSPHSYLTNLLGVPKTCLTASHLLFLLLAVFFPLFFKLLGHSHSLSFCLNWPSLSLHLKVGPFISLHPSTVEISMLFSKWH